LLDKKSDKNKKPVRLWNEFFEEDIADRNRDLNEKNQVIQPQSSERAPENKAKGLKNSFKDIAAVFKYDLDTGIVKNHLKKEDKKKYDHTETKIVSERSDF
jgi:uncharacterized protein YydD (DUF2326 family)